MHAAVPFARQDSALVNDRFYQNCFGRLIAGRSSQVYALKQVPAFTIEIAEYISLQSIYEDAEQQLAGEVRGRVSPEDRSPTRSKLFGVEIAQTHGLDT
jgi:hypothetical protein